MKRVILIHRWSGGPQDDWRPWLKTELEKLGYEVLVPTMPDTEVPVIEKWVAHLAKVVNKPDSSTFFIGHSIGCQAIMRYLDAYKFWPLETVGGAIFVAGWFDLKNLEDDEVAKIAEPWIKTPINLNKVKTVLPKSTLIISDDDPFNCFEENKIKFGELGSKIVTLHNAGHITENDGYTKLPEALEEIKSLSGTF